MKILLGILFFGTSLEATFTLSKAQRYAKVIQESPHLRPQGNFLYPDYSAWYRQQSPSYLSQGLMFLGIEGSLWTTKDFASLLAQVIRQREEEGYQNLHELVITPRKGSEYIIFGPLYGSFHSLVRILTELMARGIIDDTFKILKSDTYIVSLGNAVDNSPLNLETLTLLLALMKANPSHMIYLVGGQEADNSWLGYGLKRELSQRPGTANFDTSLSQFFATLPRALFLQDGDEVIKLSDIPSASKLECAALKGAEGKLRVCPMHAPNKGITPQVYIEGEHRLMSYRQNQGLVEFASKEGKIIWALFSAPNYWYRHYYSFMYDAFVMLTIEKPFNQSEIALYAQDIEELDGFHTRARYEVMTGKNLLAPALALPKGENPFMLSPSALNDISACKKGMHKREKKEEKQPLYIGCTLDLTKGGSPIGKAVRDGIILLMDSINAQGGIKGQMLRVVFMDDEYSPEKARQNVEDFIEKYSSNLFLCNLGSPTLETYIELVKQEKIFIFFPITGAPIFRQPDIKGIVHWRASYKTEALALTQYMIHTLKVRNFAFLYQSDSYGQGALEGSNQVIKKEGIKQVVNVGYERNTTSFASQIKIIKEASVTGLGFFSTSLAATEFIRQAGIEFFIGKTLFALSDLADESFKKFVAQRGLDIIISQFAPNPQTSSLQIVKEFRRVRGDHGLPLADVFTLEGFIASRLMLYILNKAPDYSIASINKTIDAIRDEEYEGLPLDFDAATRELVHLLWIDIGDQEWIKQKIVKEA